jgi:hypothetical protein
MCANWKKASVPTLAKQRNTLSPQQAAEIFQYKGKHDFASDHAASSHLARKYHVSSKAVRDIWSGRSWLKATFDLWDAGNRPIKRAVGRPAGKTDSKPRHRRSLVDGSHLHLTPSSSDEQQQVRDQTVLPDLTKNERRRKIHISEKFI